MRLVAVLSLLALAGCIRQTAPASDKYEVLIDHLLRRTSDLTHQITQTQNECLVEEAAMLEGKRVNFDLIYTSLAAGDDRAIETSLDYEDFVEEHNKRYPKLPWADVKGTSSIVCRVAGDADCKAHREAHNSQIRAETGKTK